MLGSSGDGDIAGAIMSACNAIVDYFEAKNFYTARIAALALSQCIKALKSSAFNNVYFNLTLIRALHAMCQNNEDGKYNTKLDQFKGGIEKPEQ